MTKQLIIGVTFWNRFPERLECFKRAYEAIETKLSTTGYNKQWLVSCEADRCVDRSNVVRFFEDNNIKYAFRESTAQVHHETDKFVDMYGLYKASLHANLNNLLRLAYYLYGGDESALFYLQDDWLLTRKMDIGQDIDFLLNSDYDLIRYMFLRRDYSKMNLINKELDLYEISHDVVNLYSDHPHLKKISFHDKYGYFPDSTDRGYDTGDCEAKFNKIIKKSDAKLLYKEGTQELFLHLSGNCSTLKEKWAGWHKDQAKKKEALKNDM